jgi:hypothetical protein
VANGLTIKLMQFGRWATTPQPHLRGRWLFLRVTAACFFAGFLALHDQFLGFVGSAGLSPLGGRWPWLESVLDAREIDALVRSESIAGLLFAVLAFLDLAPKLTLSCATVLWSVCLYELGPFDVYQPDAMLVSAGFCAAVMAPGSLRPRLGRGDRPIRIEVLMVWMLLVDIYWGCAFGKWQNPAWRSLTAMDHYYESAPVPAWTGWFVHNYLPKFGARTVCALVLATETLAPLLLLGGRRSLLCFFWLNLGLQFGIATTASHSFLNLMVIGLGCLALSDRSNRHEPASDGSAADRYTDPDTEPALPKRQRHRLISRSALAAIYVAATLTAILSRLTPSSLDPFRLRSPTRGPGHLVNTYGLYEDVGRTGYRIELQGSDDGRNWRGYRYRCLPMERGARPRLVWPYQCRVDWLMWRASKVGFVGDEPWLRAVISGLAHGSPQVASLFEGDPPRLPPERFRVVLWEYRFSTRSEREIGGWWRTRVVSVREMTLPRRQTDRSGAHADL